MILFKRMFLMILAAAVTTACAAESDPVSPDALSPEPLAAVGGAGHRVVGSGHVAVGDAHREFTVHAVEAPDGSVSGSYKSERRSVWPGRWPGGSGTPWRRSG